MTTTQPDGGGARSADGAASLGVGRVLFPGALLAVAVYVVVSSFGYGLWARLGPGPGFFPLVLGGLLGGLSLVWLVQELRPGRSSRRPVELQRDAPDPLDPEAQEPELRPRLVAVIVASLVALAVLMVVLGYQLSMLLFLVFHLRVLGRRGWLLTALVSLAGSFGLFTLFTRVLAVNLPTSSVEFIRLLGL